MSMPIKIIIFLTVMLAVISGCTSEDDSIKPQLSVDTPLIEAGCDQSRIVVNVTSNVVWSAAATDSWIRVEPAVSDNPNGSLAVTIMPNGGASRQGSIYLYAGKSEDLVATIIVEQAARGAHSTKVSKPIVALNSYERSATIDIEDVPHGWTFDIIEGASWMEVLKTPTGITIEADPLTTLWRCGLIKVRTSYDSYDIHIVQADFKIAPINTLETAYYGQLDDFPYSIGLLVAQTGIYDAPYVAQQYQDTYYIQFNISPVFESFADFCLPEGRYPFAAEDSGSSFCSAGVINANNEVFGSCMMRKWWYQGQEYGMYGSIFQEGFMFVCDNNDGTTTFYIVGNGRDLTGAQENYAWEWTGTNSYVNMLDDNFAVEAPKCSSPNILNSHTIHIIK